MCISHMRDLAHEWFALDEIEEELALKIDASEKAWERLGPRGRMRLADQTGDDWVIVRPPLATGQLKQDMTDYLEICTRMDGILQEIAQAYAYEIEERIAIRVEAGQPDDDCTRLMATREVLERVRADANPQAQA